MNNEKQIVVILLSGTGGEGSEKGHDDDRQPKKPRSHDQSKRVEKYSLRLSGSIRKFFLRSHRIGP